MPDEIPGGKKIGGSWAKVGIGGKIGRGIFEGGAGEGFTWDVGRWERLILQKKPQEECPTHAKSSEGFWEGKKKSNAHETVGEESSGG